MTAALDKLAYSPDEVAQLTSSSRTEVMAAIHRGDLPAKKRGRLYLITRASIETWLNDLPDA